jgi:hypothetical protein
MTRRLVEDVLNEHADRLADLDQRVESQRATIQNLLAVVATLIDNVRYPSVTNPSDEP